MTPSKRKPSTRVITRASEPATPLAERLQEFLESQRAPLGAVQLDLRSLGEAGITSRLMERCTLGDREAREPMLDDEELREVLKHGEPSAIADLVGRDTIHSWILVPIESRREEGVHILLGTALAHDEVSPEELERLSEATESLAMFLQPTDLEVEPQLVSLAEAMPQPLLIVDRFGHVLCMNDNFAFVFGCDAYAERGNALESVLPEAHAELFRDALWTTLHRSAAIELPLPSLSGELESMSFTLTTRLIEDVAGGVAVVFVLREVSVGLELSRLHGANDLKYYLFRILVHDLKSPISVIRNTVDLLHHDLADDPDHEAVTILDSSIARIQQMVEDFSEFTSLSFHARDLPLVATPLVDVLEPIMDVYRIQGLPHSFVLDIREPLHVRLHRPRLSRAIENLVSNAVKYSPQGGEICMTLERASEPGWARLTISDQGLGIADEYLQKVWEPFYRQDHPVFADIEGTGLGLSIARHIIQAHGGDLELKSCFGKGTTLIISLPCEDSTDTE